MAGFYDLVWDAAPEAPWQPPAIPAGTSLDPTTSLGLAFADVNHDGRADVLRLERLGTAGYRITVALSEGGGSFAPAQTWWSSIGTGPDIDPGAAVRLVAGDFEGDGLDEAGILEGAPGTPPVVMPDGTTVTPAVVPEARLYLLDSTGSAFSAPRLAWSGSLDVSRAQAFAADVTGDGRADLVIASDLYPVGLPNPPAGPPAVGPDGAELPVGIRVLVAPALRNGTLAPLQGWADVTDTTQAQSQVAVEDVNRDGMSDVVILRATGATGSELVGLISSGTRFSRVSMWTSGELPGERVEDRGGGSQRRRPWRPGGPLRCRQRRDQALRVHLDRIVVQARRSRGRSVTRVERRPAVLTRVTPREPTLPMRARPAPR